MTATNPNEQNFPVEVAEPAAEPRPDDNLSTPEPVEETPPAESADAAADSNARRILIGSQRDPAAYRPKPRHEFKPLREPRKSRRGPEGQRRPANDEPDRENRRPDEIAENGGLATETAPPATAIADDDPAADAASSDPAAAPPRQPGRTPELVSRLAEALSDAREFIPKPSIRDRLSPDLEDELQMAMGGVSMDDFLDGSAAGEQTFEPGELQSGRVVAVRRDDVFVEFAGIQQGVVPLRMFDVPPRPGAEVQVVVERLNPEDGLYELGLPNKAVQVDDWSDLAEGALVDVRVTGHNAGGLECEVNHIRGFIPVSQIDLYRVDDMAQFVDQKWTCVITEANPERRNLVLSRRAVLERERERAREELLDSLRTGQIREGVVSKLMDFGAFVDLGGVDGLIHVSQVAWSRVKHPGDVLKEGQQVKVRVDRIDPETGKISLAYRDLMESPWTTAAQKFPPQSVAAGIVTKLMDFGAFVELEPGIEGLVHISELSHKRVFRCSDVVKEGQEVEVMVISVDPEAQRMSLSMKQMSAPPETAKKADEGPAEPSQSSKKRAKPTGPLKGGLGRKTGDRFGLKW